MGLSSYVFKVQAAKDVYVALSSVPRQYNTLTYEVRIGTDENTMSSIEKSDGLRVDAPTVDILSPSAYLDFWVAWDGGNIRFGRGEVIGSLKIN